MSYRLWSLGLIDNSSSNFPIAGSTHASVFLVSTISLGFFNKVKIPPFQLDFQERVRFKTEVLGEFFILGKS